MFNYFKDFPFQPHKHQLVTILHFLKHERTHCWNGTGTGKTACVLWAFDILRKKCMINKLLIVSTKSSLYNTWGKHAFLMLPRLKREILDGSKEKRVLKLASNPDIAIINHDGIKICAKEIIKWCPDMVVIDESTAFKRKGTARWKTMRSITDIAKRVIPMSGTPFAQAPTDVWAVSLFVCPNLVGKSFTYFRMITMYQVDKWKWLAKPNVEEVIKQHVKPVIRIKREDCLDLPPVQYMDLDVEFSEKQRKAFGDLKKLAVTMIDSGSITAVHAGALRIKLLQCCCGFVYGVKDNLEKMIADLQPKNRLDLLLDTINECERGVLVFTSFKSVVEHLFKFLKDKEINCSMIYGDTSMKDRHRIIDEFQQGNIKVLVLHPRTMAHSITLTYADTIIWYEVTSDNELYEQANARINRMGQEYKMRVIHFISSSFEKLVLDKLRKKQSMQNVILEAFGDKNDK